MPQRCGHVRANGEPCRGTARTGSTYCFAHDPAAARQRRAARVRGGRARSRPRATLPADTPDVPLNTVADVVAMLAATINDVRKGKVDVKVGSVVGFLSGHLIAALKLGPLEARLAEVEARLNGQQQPPQPAGGEAWI